MQHKGYNNVLSIQNGNSTAQKWKYNDTEYNESFAMNMYEMPLRSYDPALARWNTIDPIVHFSLSTYNAFDNNPVFWADPSGADAYNNIMNLFNNAKGGITTFVNDNWGGFDQIRHMSDEELFTTPGAFEHASLAFGGGGGGNKGKKKGKHTQPTYIPAPKTLPGFPGAERLPNKKGKRPGWRLPDGSLGEWDSQHGEVEVYDKTGKKHKGAYDPDTGELKPDSRDGGRTASRAKFEVQPDFKPTTAPIVLRPPSTQQVQTMTIGTILLIVLVVAFSPVGL